MRIDRTSSVSSAGTGKGEAGKPASGFSLPAPASAAGTARLTGTGASMAAGGIDALMALQGLDTPEIRRDRALRRGRRMLDALDRLRLGVLEDDLRPAHVDLLRRSVRDARESVDDPALQALLNEIELRAEVEIAKFDARRAVA
jgi:hypothetical protein